MGLLDKARGEKTAPQTTDLVTDPVCGMRIEPAQAAGTSTHQDKTIHFCSTGCKQKFDADPARYAAKIA